MLERGVNKVPRIKLFPKPKKRVRWITRNKATKLISELPEYLASMATFALATGLRQRNVSYLCCDQVDINREMAWVHAINKNQNNACHPIKFKRYKCSK